MKINIYSKFGVRKVVRVNANFRAWFEKNNRVFFPFLAFVLPLIVRTIPEILMGPFLVGFDTIAYYVPNTITWLKYGVSFPTLITSAPLFYGLLIGLSSVGISIIISIKILSPIILGLLGLAVYFYAEKALSWSSKKSLLAALFSTLYFVALRISWDMLRSELALVFLFLGLIFLQKKNFDSKTGLLLSVTMFMVALTHQLVTVIMFMIVVATILILTIKKKWTELFKLMLCSIPAVSMFATIIYINYFVFSTPSYFGGLESILLSSRSDLVINTLGFLVFCYLPMIPLLIFSKKGFRDKIQLNAWIVWLFVPIILVIISPTLFFVGGVLPYRWILLLTYPLAFYAVEALSTIKWRRYKILVSFILAIFSFSFLFLPNSGAYSYYDNFPSYIPNTMLQNTLQFSDCQDTTNALLWAKNMMPKNGVLLVHEAFYGWATLVFDSDNLSHYFFDSPTGAIQKMSNDTITKPLYLIWWVNGTGWYGQPIINAAFEEIYHSGNIAIYKYSKNS